ncbi:MAG: hypothetical protein IT572_08670 [Deltaproteobacteria bacterium]|nr:hypothetical protein [Deltaproteobacteria bacterium]
MGDFFSQLTPKCQARINAMIAEGRPFSDPGKDCAAPKQGKPRTFRRLSPEERNKLVPSIKPRPHPILNKTSPNISGTVGKNSLRTDLAEAAKKYEAAVRLFNLIRNMKLKLPVIKFQESTEGTK